MAALLIQALSPAAHGQSAVQDTPPAHPTGESQRTDVVPRKNTKKIDKYDVNRIGQRGIGRGLNVYSATRERELGQNLAAAFDRNTKLVDDPVIVDYINGLGQKIVRNSDAHVPFTIKVIDSGDIPHAFGLPGGFLYVDSGLILAADGEAELAGVMAHEIAHVAARHATRALTRKKLWNLADSLVLLAGPASAVLEDIGSVAGPLSVRKFSRDAEYEADLLGIEYAYAAGYDPEAFLVALEKLHAIELKMNATFAKIPGYHLATKLPLLSTLAKSLTSCPLTQERIHHLQSDISTFLPDRKDYILDTNEFQAVKSRLLASQAPILHHLGPGEGNGKGPVLRRGPRPAEDVLPRGILRNGARVDKGTKIYAI